MTHRVVQPDGWPRPKGYANGVAARGTVIAVAGQVGWDATQRMVPGGMAAQARQALANVVAVLRAAGAGPEHLVRMTWYVTDRAAYRAASREIGAAFRELVGHYAIAMSAVQVTALMEDDAVVEIEATAVVPDA